jgi:hypothetical protein
MDGPLTYLLDSSEDLIESRICGPTDNVEVAS